MLLGLVLLLVPFLERRSARGELGRLFTWIVIGAIVYIVVLTFLGYASKPMA